MDLANDVRKTMVEKMREKFADLDLTFSIGGQISFDLFPKGWDKTYCLRYVCGGGREGGRERGVGGFGPGLSGWGADFSRLIF